MNSTIDYYNSHISELVERYNKADVKSMHRLFDRYIVAPEKPQKSLDSGLS